MYSQYMGGLKWKLCYKKSRVLASARMPPLVCSQCGDSFRHKKIYEAHVNRHVNRRPHACDVCGKFFLVESHLKQHIKTHTLPYQCDQCEVRVASSGGLKDHIRVVHERIQLQCRYHWRITWSLLQRVLIAFVFFVQIWLRHSKLGL